MLKHSHVDRSHFAGMVTAENVVGLVERGEVIYTIGWTDGGTTGANKDALWTTAVPANGMPDSLEATLPPLSVLFLKRI